jgi:hypothetical protein
MEDRVNNKDKYCADPAGAETKVYMGRQTHHEEPKEQSV